MFVVVVVVVVIIFVVVFRWQRGSDQQTSLLGDDEVGERNVDKWIEKIT